MDIEIMLKINGVDIKVKKIVFSVLKDTYHYLNKRVEARQIVIHTTSKKLRELMNDTEPVDIQTVNKNGKVVKYKALIYNKGNKWTILETPSRKYKIWKEDKRESILQKIYNFMFKNNG